LYSKAGFTTCTNPIPDESSFRQQLDAAAERFERPEAEERRERSKNALHLATSLPTRIEKTLIVNQSIDEYDTSVSPPRPKISPVDLFHGVPKIVLQEIDKLVSGLLRGDGFVTGFDNCRYWLF
jgi:hypothetical protein